MEFCSFYRKLEHFVLTRIPAGIRLSLQSLGGLRPPLQCRALVGVFITVLVVCS